MDENNRASFITKLEKTLREIFRKYPALPPQHLRVRYNLVVVGKSGAGKSELINYLFGEQVVESGIGTPVTQLGFHRTDLMISSVLATIWDSAGLEVGDPKKWENVLRKELDSRGPTEDVEKWFHTILYCIQARGRELNRLR
jgi:predicted GTPase